MKGKWAWVAMTGPRGKNKLTLRSDLSNGVVVAERTGLSRLLLR